MLRWLCLAVVLTLAGVWQQWGTRGVSHPPGVLVSADPVQLQLTAGTDPPLFRKQDADIRALARFEMRARALGVERYRFDAMAKLAPVDIAFGWGPMSDSRVLARLSIAQGNRFYHWSTADFPIPRREIETHSANMHLIAADPLVERRIGETRPGQVVTLSGYLVEVKAASGWTIRSSLTREDTGAGACEVIWVESFELE